MPASDWHLPTPQMMLETRNTPWPENSDSTLTPAPSIHDDLLQDITYGTDCDPIYPEPLNLAKEKAA